MSRRLVTLLFLHVWWAALACADDADGPSQILETEQFDLSHIDDRTELSFEESEAYYALLEHVRQVPGAELRAAAEDVLQARWEDSPQFQQWPIAEFPLFYDLTQHPEKYRGQPITMRGHLVRLVRYAAGENDYGIETLYEGWLVTPDAETHPTTVICTEIPPGMPIGEELIDGVSVTGYFFKLHTYPSRDRKTRFAPMVLARTMRWTPPDELATGWPVSEPLMISVLAVVALLAGGIVWVSARRNRAAREARFRSDVPGEAPEFLKKLSP